MANSDKNIRITTSKNKTTYPNIVFTGSAAGSSVITLEVLDDNTLSFTSNEGQVFSIDSNLSSGTIWAVSDISGVPMLSSSAGGTVGLAVYGGIVGIGQTNPTYKLDLKGSFGLASANDGLYNFIFSNSAASGSNSLSIRSANSLLLYNSGNTFYTGFKSNAATNITYTLPTTDGSSGQFLQTNGSATLTWATATGSGGTGSTAGVGQGGQYEMAYYPGTGLSVVGSNTFSNNTSTGVVSITHSTVSTDFSNGAFKVTGGVGIGGSLYVGGIGASITGVTFSNSTITRGTWNGTAISPTYGGTGLNNSSATGLLQYSSGTASVITTSAALASIISDETGTAGKLVFSTSPVFTTSVTTDSGSFSVFNTTATTINAFGAATTLSVGAATGKATFNSTDDSSSTTTGSLAVSGGAGIAKSVSIGGRLQMFNGANFTAFVSSASGNTVYTLPATSPATGSSVLQSTAQGVMSWVPMVASSSGAGSGTVAIPDAQYRIAFYAGTGASVSSTNLITAVGTGVTILGATNASSTTVAALSILGGLGVTGNAFIGGTTSVTSTQTSISTNSGALVVLGGVGIGGSLYTSTSNASSISGVVLLNNAVTASTINKVTVTAPTTSATFTLVDGSTLITSGANSLTLTTTATTNVTFPSGTKTLVATDVTSLASLNTVGIITSGTWAGTVITSLYGGTGFNSYTIGDILVASTGTSLAKLSAGSTNFVLTSNGTGTVPSWQSVPPSAASSVAVIPTTLNQSFFITAVSSSNGSGLGLSTITTFVINPNSGIVSLSGLAVTSGLNASSTTSAAFNVYGGLGITGNAFIGGTTNITSSAASIGTNSGALVVTGGVGIGGSLYTSAGSTSSVSGVLLQNGNVSASTYNKLIVSSPASSATLTIADGSSLITSGANSLTLTTTATTNATFPSGTKTLVATDVTSLASLTTASSLNSIGTIATGVWNGTAISSTYGGTGLNNSGQSGILKYTTGTGSLVAAPTGAIVGTTDSQTLTNKTYNSVTITAPASTATLTLANLSSLITSGGHSLTFTTTNTTSVTLPTTGTLATTSNKLSDFAATTSSELLNTITGETGSGALVFGTSPEFTTSITTPSTTFSVFNATATTINAFGAATTLSLGASTGTATFNSINNTTAANTGSVVFSGGVGIGKSVSIGGNLLLFNSSTYTGFKSNQVGTGSTVYTLPTRTPESAVGTSVLSSTIDGVMSWVGMAAGGGPSGTINSSTVNNIAFYSAATTLSGDSVASGNYFFYNGTNTGLNIAHADNEFNPTASTKLLTVGTGATNYSTYRKALAVISTNNAWTNGDLLVLGVGALGSDVRFGVDWTGRVQIGTPGTGFTLPATNGTSGQVLTANTNGLATWTTVSSSGAGSGTVAIPGAQYQIAAYYSGSGASVSGSTTFTNNTSTGIVNITHATESTSSTTGALTVAGGAGIAKSLFVGTTLSVGQAPGYTVPNNLASFVSTVNSYNQLVIQNKSNGASASANLVVNNDSSTDSTFYGEIGMNSSTFSGTGALGAANATYVAATSGPLVLGTTTSHPIRFVVNSGATDTMYIAESGTAVSVFTNLDLRSQNKIRFFNSGNTFNTGLQAGANTVNYTLSLPTAPVGAGASVIVTGSDGLQYFAAPGSGIAFSSATANTPIIRTKRPIALQFSAGFTPLAAGPDNVVIRVPESSTDGTTVLTYNLRRFQVRVETPSAGSSRLQLERSSTDTGTFTLAATGSSHIGGFGVTITGAGIYLTSVTTFSGSLVTSGNLFRLNWTLLNATHANFSVNLLLEEV